uniref:Uncharacterized protein n=1 Tax=Trichuris muris TaxID=70415 RepID=A0A5S6Q6U9_TRIMR
MPLQVVICGDTSSESIETDNSVPFVVQAFAPRLQLRPAGQLPKRRNSYGVGVLLNETRVLLRAFSPLGEVYVL